jgi:hypothetical protein
MLSSSLMMIITPLLCFGRLTMRAKAQWERSDRVTLMIMDNTINPVIRGALPKSMSRFSWLKLKNIFRDPLKLMPASS